MTIERTFGTVEPGAPTDEFVAHAFAEGAHALWPDSQDPGWRVTFDRWLAAHVAARVADSWPCANYTAPVTCLTAPSSETARCGHCRAQLKEALAPIEALADECERLAVWMCHDDERGIPHNRNASHVIRAALPAPEPT